MKNQSQVRKNGSKTAAATQHKTTPGRAGESATGGTTIIALYPDGREWARADFDGRVSAQLQSAADACALSPAEIIRAALEEKLKAFEAAADSRPKKPQGGAGKPYMAREFKVVALREYPLPEALQLCDGPGEAAGYWRQVVVDNPYFNPDCECLVVLALNTRRHVKGHQLVSIGTLDTVLIHAREIFRGAIVASAAAVVLMHNHPSGDPSPSEGDLKATRGLIQAGKVLGIEVLDHIIMGQPSPAWPSGYYSLREGGHFGAPEPVKSLPGPSR